MITGLSFYARLTVIVAKNRPNMNKPEIRINPEMKVQNGFSNTEL